MVVLERPDPHPVAPGVELELVVDGQPAAGERPGHDGAGALGGEGPVDPQPRSTVVGRGRRGRQEVVEGGPQVVQPDIGGGVHVHDGGTLEEGASQALLEFEVGQFDEVLVGDPDLGQRHDPVGDAEQLEDAEVLLGLRLPALGGGDDEQAGVDGAHPGQHVLDEPHVAGHVHQRQRRTRGQRRGGEPQVDGQATGLLLGEPVGVGPG